MILKRRVALNGVQLDSIDNRILIQGIEPAAGKQTISTVSIWNGDGSRVTAEHRDSLDIVVKFTINEKSYRPAERSQVLEAVNGWAAGGGWLTLNHKPDRRVRVMAAQLPAEGDAMQRNEYSITFRAYGVPYWQQAESTKLQMSGSSGSRAFGVPGNQRTVMEATFRNTSGGTIHSLTINAGGSSFTFSQLGLGNGETLTIDHSDNGRRSVLRLRIGSRSVMDKRTGSNDLWVEPGTRTVSYTAGGSGVMTFSCCGRYA